MRFEHSTDHAEAVVDTHISKSFGSGEGSPVGRDDVRRKQIGQCCRKLDQPQCGIPVEGKGRGRRGLRLRSRGADPQLDPVDLRRSDDRLEYQPCRLAWHEFSRRVVPDLRGPDEFDLAKDPPLDSIREPTADTFLERSFEGRPCFRLPVPADQPRVALQHVHDEPALVGHVSPCSSAWLSP